jgi:hypothetical protein
MDFFDTRSLNINIMLQLLHEGLEEFLTNWKDRISQKSLSLVIITGYGDNIKSEVNSENIRIIKFKTYVNRDY